MIEKRYYVFNRCSERTYNRILKHCEESGWEIGYAAAMYKPDKYLVLIPSEKRVGYTVRDGFKSDPLAHFIKFKIDFF